MTHPEYSTLIRDTIAYLKESPAFVFSTKEEWEALQELKAQLPPVRRAVATMPPAPVAEAPIRMRISSPNETSPDRILEKKAPLAQEKSPCPIPSSSSCSGIKIKSFLQRSSVPLTEHIPDDSAVTKEISAYKEYIGAVDVVIFACDAEPDTLSLIKNLSKSIDQKLGPVKVLRSDRWEKEGRWDAFLTKNPIKLVIASSGFSQLKGAMSHYVSPDGGSSSFLKTIPLIILSPCAVYSQSPKEKLILWNQICSILKS